MLPRIFLLIYFFVVCSTYAHSSEAVYTSRVNYINDVCLDDGFYISSDGSALIVKTHTGLFYTQHEQKTVFKKDNSSNCRIEITSGKNFPIWSYNRKNTPDFAHLSTTKAIVDKKINLPMCRYGNICAAGNDFIIDIKGSDEDNFNDFNIFIGDAEVTTLFYYSDGYFRLKEHYKDKFWSFYNSAEIKENNYSYAVLSWSKSTRIGDERQIRLPKKANRVNIIKADNQITGTLLDNTGKPLAGVNVELSYPGSDYIIPHAVNTKTDDNGRYTFNNLPLLDYFINFEGYPPLDTKVESLSNDLKKLSLVHIKNFNFTTLSGYMPGDFVVLPLEDIITKTNNKNIEIRQISGENLILTNTKGYLAFIMPYYTGSGEDIILKVNYKDKNIPDEKNFEYILIKTQKTNFDSYTQFSVFDTQGVYAKTAIDGASKGTFVKKNPFKITAYVDSVANVKSHKIKVHYYNDKAKAYDVTSFFNLYDNKAVIARGGYTSLYNKLSSSGTLAFTFCDDSKDCFRIKKTIRRGDNNLKFNIIANFENKDSQPRYFIIKEITNSSVPYIKAVVLSNGKAVFNGIPEGTYRVTLADFNLKFWWDEVVDIKHGEDIVMEVKPSIASSSSQISKRQGSKRSFVMNKPLILYPNDYRIVNFDNASSGRLEKMYFLGDIPASLHMRSDGGASIHAKEDVSSSKGGLLAVFIDKVFFTPISYTGTEYVVVSEKDKDYTMCPDERPICKNAFVFLGGIRQGIYNGQFPLRIILPSKFNPKAVRVYLESDVDITSMFFINSEKQVLTLKKSLIPGFLSTLASSSLPLTVHTEDRVYDIDIIPGYKSIEVITDNKDNMENSPGDLSVRASCQYKPERYFSQTLPLDNNGSAMFKDMPDCSYTLDIVDKRGIYKGQLDNVVLQPGDNFIRASVPLSCDSGNIAFIKGCEVSLPIITQDDTPIVPDFGVMFIDSNLFTTVTTKPFVYADILDGGMPVYFDKQLGSTHTEIKLSGNGYQDNITIKTYSLKEKLIDIKRGEDKDFDIRVDGVTDAFIYNGEKPLAINFLTKNNYNLNDIEIALLNDSGIHNLKNMFLYNNKTKRLTIKNAFRQELLTLLNHKQAQMVIKLAPSDDVRSAIIVISIGAVASDIGGICLSGLNDYSGFKGVIIGQQSRNGYYYRDSALVSPKGGFSFLSVPEGVYDIVIFNMDKSYYGKREVLIEGEQSDTYIEVNLTKFANSKL